MYKITFECETITPMFLAGADQRTPELRAPSIKGALRFWWRAMHGDLQTNTLKEDEAKIFGGTGNAPQKSLILLRTRVLNATISNNLRKIVWDENRKRPKDGYEGTAYLLYSTFMQNREKPFFKKLKFELLFMSRDKSKLKEAGHCFWLLSNLGGLGTRARRGAGNFRVLNITDEHGLLKDIDFRTNSIQDNKGLTKYLKHHLSLIKQMYINNNNSNFQFSNLTNMKLFVGPALPTAWEALNFMGSNYQKFRSRREPDYTKVKKYLQENISFDELEKSGFGLPILYRFRSLNGKTATIEGASKNRRRSASHLIFRVIRGQNNSFFPILITFNTKILPNEDKIIVKTKNKKPLYINQPSSNIINEFINSFKDLSEVLI